MTVEGPAVARVEPEAVDGIRRGRWWVAAVGLVGLAAVSAVVALRVTGGIAQPLPGLSDPGTLTRWGLPAARGVHDAAAALTVGLLVLAATVLPPGRGESSRQLAGVRAVAVRAAGASGSVWVLAGTTVLVLAYADIAGTSPLALGTGEQVLFFAAELDLGRAYAASILLAGLVTTGSWLATRTTTAGLLALVALAALLPLSLVGHSATPANHEAAVDTLAAHLIGVTVWVGGLAGLALLRRRLGDQLPVAAGRYSMLAGWCFGLVAVSGLVNAAVRVDGWAVLSTSYGFLLIGKTAALVALGAAGWWQRRHVLTALDFSPGSGRLFGRLAGIELTVMAVAIGLAVALARTATSSPLAALPTETIAESLLGYPMPPALTVAGWVTAWRVDVLWVSLAVFAAAWYLAAVRRLRRGGGRWPVGRTVGWLAGCAVLVWATSSGPGVYSGVLFSMHVVRYLTIAAVVPLLLVLGAPTTLAVRAMSPRRDGSRGRREWVLLLMRSRLLRAVSRPAVAGTLFMSSLVVFYYSPLLTFALSSHPGHVLMTVWFLLTGCLVAGSLLTPESPSARRRLRLSLPIALLVFYTLFGMTIVSSDVVLAREWFAALPREWGPTPDQDRYRGGVLAVAFGGVPLALLAAVATVSTRRHRATATVTPGG